MKAVMLSIQPKWIELIASGKKTVEVRRTKPKIDVPFKCYIYCTKGEAFMKTAGNGCFIDKGYRQGENLYGLYEFVNGKVIGEFVCDKVFTIKPFLGSYRCEGLTRLENDRIASSSQLSLYDMRKYLLCNNGYAWQITDLVIYDKPKELSEFRKICQSDYCHTCDYAVKKNGYLVDCDRSVKRPPQSYMFVEELKGETE